MGLVLADLTPTEFAHRRPHLIASYADLMIENYGVSAEEAQAEALRQTDGLLPQGVHTPGQFLRKGMADGGEVGFLWISMPGNPYPSMAWVAEIEVAAAHRSRGHGSAMLLAGEADLVERGVHRVGLHVFGANTGARNLYRRLGYRMLAQLRTRHVGAPGSPVTLEPMTPQHYADRLDHLIATNHTTLTRDPTAPRERAREVAAVLAPDGVDSRNVFVRSVVAEGRPVGWVWFSLPNPHRPSTGTVHYVHIDEPHRHLGLGRAAVTAAEAEFARHGVPRMGLWISAASPGAEAFTARLGLDVASEQMVKDL